MNLKVMTGNFIYENMQTRIYFDGRNLLNKVEIENIGLNIKELVFTKVNKNLLNLFLRVVSTLDTFFLPGDYRVSN